MTASPSTARSDPLGAAKGAASPFYGHAASVRASLGGPIGLVPAPGARPVNLSDLVLKAAFIVVAVRRHGDGRGFAAGGPREPPVRGAAMGGDAARHNAELPLHPQVGERGALRAVVRGSHPA